jgi:hypothetical protein
MNDYAGITDFEPIYAAFWGYISSIPGIVTASRRVKHWSDVLSSEQPALFMGEDTERAAQKKGVPPKWTLGVRLYLYVHSGEDPDAIPALAMNQWLKAIREALEPEATAGALTLRKLVSHAWIVHIERDGGLLGGQSVASIDVEILAA